MRQHYGDSLTLRRFRISTIGEDANSVELPQPSPEQRRLIDEIAAANKELAEREQQHSKVPVMRACGRRKLRATQHSSPW